MNRKLLAGVVVLVILAGLAVVWRTRGGTGVEAPAAASNSTGGAAKVTPPPSATADRIGLEMGEKPDPRGKLLLEGQVLDDEGKPLGGAKVTLSSSPSRDAVSGEHDGSFSFDNLIARRYSLTARSGELVGGVTYRLSDKNPEPAIIKMIRGLSVTVKVIAEPDATPVAGAKVSLPGDDDVGGTTGSDGQVVVRGVAPGWVSVNASAAGYAAGHAFKSLPRGTVNPAITVTLKRGAVVSGRVVDPARDPVRGAKVRLDGTSSGWGMEAAQGLGQDSIVTDEHGAFSFPVVAAGTYKVVARHPERAPGSSAPFVTDGVTRYSDLEIVLAPGRTISGVVVTSSGAPVPHATVHGAPKAVGDLMAGTPTEFSDEAGKCSITGLAAAPFRVRAESDDAASVITDVELTESDKHDLRLVLDVTGVIAGVVVDSVGEPVAEVQVTAVPDFWSGAELSSLMLGGFSTATTDGGGGFAITGLAEGNYQLSAGSAVDMQRMFSEKAMVARTGDKNVRLVLPARGAIKGKVAMARTGKVPAMATVQVGWQPAVTVVAGEFELQDLAPGKYDLKVRGLEFAELHKRDVTVTSGKTTDVGTIVVHPGRVLTGTVLGNDGKPVSGARVTLGTSLVRQSGVGDDDDAEMAQLMGNRVATTDERGAFVIRGISAKENWVMAEHSIHGRSDSSKVPAGDKDPLPVELKLKGVGSISGKVSSKGKPVVGAIVMLGSGSDGEDMAMATSTADGAYLMEKVTEGKHELMAARTSMTGLDGPMGVAKVEVKAGQESEVNIEIPAGEITLKVVVRARVGHKIDAAQVFLVRGVAAVKNAKEIEELFKKSAGDLAGVGFSVGGAPATFSELIPGRHTACSIPITGDMRDPTFMQRLQENSDNLLVFCTGVEVLAAPKEQTFTQEVPSMVPLPEPAP
jgi:uncharacterized GH25 family protein